MADFDITRVAGNIGAMNALNALTNINKQLSVHQTRLASGKRINSAADDPAGLTIATKMLARSEGLKVALSNIGDAKSLLAVAESGLGRINDILVQMRNKAEAGASDTMGSAERAALVSQMKAYAAQIDDIVKQTKWTSSSPSLIGGAFSSTALTFQTGADQGDVTQLSGLVDVSASGLTGTGLAIASVAADSSAAELTDGDSILSSPTAGAAANANLAQLTSGVYTVRLTVDAATGTDDKVELLDSAGNALLISQTPADGTGTVAKSVLIDSDTNPATVNFGNGLTVTIAAGKAAGTYTATVNYVREGDYTLERSGGVDLTGGSSAADFADYMNWINTKLDVVSGQISMLGALNGRLTFKEDHVSAAQINTEGAYNRIMNANMAEEQVNASKFIILQQTATAMLAQANAAPQFLLSLFR